MQRKKYALLDTDFLSKIYASRIDRQNTLLDRLIELPCYEFYCHEKIREEIGDCIGKDSESANTWLSDQIEAGRIICYTDEMILSELTGLYHKGGFTEYLLFLKRSCDIWESGYFEQAFGKINVPENAADISKFIQELTQCEAAVGRKQSLGEKKTFVLYQMLELFHPGEVFVFCSDDIAARNGIAGIGSMNCMSIIAAFYTLKQYSVEREIAYPYFAAYERFLSGRNQSALRVWSWIGLKTLSRGQVDCRQIFEEIYEDKFEVRKNGELQYKQELSKK